MLTSNVIIDLLKENNISITGVLHLGAHKCEELSFYTQSLALNSSAVIWIEADETLCKENRKNGIENMYQCVISEKDNEPLTFHVSNHKQSSSLLELGTHRKHHPDIHYIKDIMVRSLTVDTFFSWIEKDAKSYNFWNINIQGAEMKALRGAPQSLDYLDAICIKVTTEKLYVGCSTLDELDSFFLGIGFHRIRTEMTRWSWGDALYIRKERIIQLTPPVKSHYENLIDNLNTKNNEFLLINPFSLYTMCDHFIGTEHLKECAGVTKGKNDLSKNKNLSLIKDFDIIHCQVDFLQMFFNQILTKIDKQIVLTTGQWHLPQIHKSDLSEKILNHPQIIFWFSQNPIYESGEKYIAFPYGLKHNFLSDYSKELLKLQKKNINLSCLHLGKTHPCRDKFPKATPLNINEYYAQLARAKFILSPIGDRDDCYRHYEAIGLGTTPISNVNINYKSIFGSNMVYESDDNMVKMLAENSCPTYVPPNKDLICTSFYEEKIRKMIFQKKHSF